MANREEFRNHLAKLFIDETGVLTPNLYFQPPETVKISYPCFIYHKISPNIQRASNSLYLFTEGYNVLWIDKNPDNQMNKRIYEEFDYVSSSSPYVSDNLYHTSFDIYY